MEERRAQSDHRTNQFGLRSNTLLQGRDHVEDARAVLVPVHTMRRAELADEIRQHLCDVSDAMMDMTRECNMFKGGPDQGVPQPSGDVLEDFDEQYEVGGGE